jgi:hypothetical protein
MKAQRYKATRFWAVYDADGSLICVTVDKRGAAEVVRRLTQQASTG